MYPPRSSTGSGSSSSQSSSSSWNILGSSWPVVGSFYSPTPVRYHPRPKFSPPTSSKPGQFPERRRPSSTTSTTGHSGVHQNYRPIASGSNGVRVKLINTRNMELIKPPGGSIGSSGVNSKSEGAVVTSTSSGNKQTSNTFAPSIKTDLLSDDQVQHKNNI
jgi:hypothetical protein